MFDRLRPPSLSRTQEWTPEYVHARDRFISETLDDQQLLARFRSRRRLPRGYGVGLDERVIEYPWLFAQEPVGRVLDAGSTLNLGGTFAVAENSMPDFEVDEEPEPIAVSPGTRSVLLRQLPERRRPEQTPCASPRSEHELLDNGPERPPEPPSHRDGEPHLSPGEDRSRHPIRKRCPQHGLGP